MAHTIALVGNPNSGKTTMFNALTGARQYVGNWPGVTVERKGGKLKSNRAVEVTDLPGVYSLSPYSPEEIVTRDYLLSGEPDVVIDLVDATNLERNLYLTTQIIDLGIPVVIALNMIDLVEKSGDKIDIEKLSKKLGCPVIPTSALKGTGMDKLIETALDVADKRQVAQPSLTFTKDSEKTLSQIAEIVGNRVAAPAARWHAIKLLEGEERTKNRIKLSPAEKEQIENIRLSYEQIMDDDAESAITTERYDLIVDVVADTYKRSLKGMSTSEKIDRIVTSRIWGLPIFILVMFLVYYIAISTVGTAATDWVNDNLFGEGWLISGTEEDGLFMPSIPDVASGWLESIGAADWVEGLVVDGVIAGVGAVLGFLPQMAVLFLELAILEGCGYMARIAFLMDRIFRRFGLSGKSFIPMLVASGCGVPAVMACKAIEDEKSRRMTVMTSTMIPCSAKTPIIALIFGAIVGGNSAETWWVAPLFYFLGVMAIIISGIMLRKTRLFAGQAAPFVMELPAYHIPSGRNVLQSTWERCKAFIIKAGTIIFASSVVIWFLLSFGVGPEGGFGLLDPEMALPHGVESHLEYSLMAAIGRPLGILFAPLGFGDWQATVTTITGLVAKENVVNTVAIITAAGDVAEGDPSLWTAFSLMFAGSVPAMVAFCAFNLLCAPCFAAMGAIRGQMVTAKWFWIAIGYMCGFAWVVGCIIYQFGMALSGQPIIPGLIVAIILLAGLLFQIFRPMPHFDDKKSHGIMAEPEAA